MVSGQRQNLKSSFVQPWKDTNKERTGPTVHKSLKGGLKLEVGATFEHNNFTPERPCCFTYFACLLLEHRGP